MVRNFNLEIILLGNLLLIHSIELQLGFELVICNGIVVVKVSCKHIICT